MPTVIDAKALRNILDKIIASGTYHIHIHTTLKGVSLYGFTRKKGRICCEHGTTNYLLSHEISSLDKIVCPNKDLSSN